MHSVSRYYQSLWKGTYQLYSKRISLPNTKYILTKPRIMACSCKQDYTVQQLDFLVFLLDINNVLPDAQDDTDDVFWLVTKHLQFNGQANGTNACSNTNVQCQLWTRHVTRSDSSYSICATDRMHCNPPAAVRGFKMIPGCPQRGRAKQENYLQLGVEDCLICS